MTLLNVMSRAKCLNLNGSQMAKLKVLFLCTGNSCRSQMAEGWARALKGELIECYSAGVDPRELDADAVRVMAEKGIDIGDQRSKHVNDFRFILFDYVVTVCDRARENCPPFLVVAKTLHVGFDDPRQLAKCARTHEQALNHYRRVRDEIKALIETFPARLLDKNEQRD